MNKNIQKALTVTSICLLLGWSMGQAATYEEAQKAYRSNNFQKAADLLEQRLKTDPKDQDARILLAFSLYQLGKHQEGLDALKNVSNTDPDAALARALLLARLNRPEEARQILKAALQAHPKRQDIAQELKKYPEVFSEKDLPAFKRPAQMRMPYKLDSKGFLTAAGKRIEVKGVNFGVALPGRFPSEFPEKKYYQQWLKMVGEMNANVVRAYTILPPSFYESLHEYNQAHKQDPIYLIHGVWTELPEDDEYREKFEAQFYKEARDVINVLHGRAAIPPVPGHASGLYLKDVSPYLLGIIIGREWEPYSVIAFNELAKDFTSYKGKYLQASNVLPMEAWLARIMDRIIDYQVETYNQQTPIAFTNWPTLDPMTHISESTREEENVIRRRLGEQFEKSLVNEFNNDEVGLDSLKIQETSLFKAGQFASYHAYPYYPDFMNLEEGFSKHPVSNYQGYLELLKKHHKDQPILISEIGVPSSRSVAHFQNQGYTHGGHSEAEQARINVELFQQIKDAGLAGGIMFALLDEWFKRNWLYMDFELPADHNPRWLSVMDAEQNYGILAAEDAREVPLCAAPPSKATVLDAQKGLKAWVTAAYLHLWLPTTRATEFRLDTHPAAGDEYEVVIQPGGISEVKVNAAYAPFIEVQDSSYPTLIFNRWATPKPNEAFVPIVSQPNRRRYGRDEKLHPRKIDFPGILRPGDESKGRDATRDLCIGKTYTHVRLPWTLINVSDPSSRFVVDFTRDEGYLPIKGIQISWEGKSYPFTWDTWVDPEFTLRVKPVFNTMKKFWSQ